MLYLTIQPASEDDLIAGAKFAVVKAGERGGCYGIDQQSVEVPHGVDSYIWASVNKRGGSQGLGRVVNTLEELDLAPSSLRANLDAIEEINDALEELKKPRATITRIAALYQPFRLYVELDTGGTKFIMSYQKSFQKGTGHRMLMDGVRPKIQDSSTHGPSLRNWLKDLGEPQAKPQRSLPLFVRVPMQDKPDTDKQRNLEIAQLALELGAIENGMKHDYGNSTAQQRWDYDFREQGLTFETKFATVEARDTAIRICKERGYQSSKRSF
jgi:hypothetical protein